MNLDLSQFRKVKDTKDAAVLRHVDQGHEIHLSKKSLAPKLQKDLASLPTHYDVGGRVTDSYQTPQSDQNAQQPTIIINNGPQPQAQPQPAQAPNYFTNGTFDFNKFALQNPQAPVESKMRAIEQMDQQKAVQEQGQQAIIAKGQAEYQKALEYNQIAASRGLPQIPLPNVPSPINPAAQPMLAQANGPIPESGPEITPDQRAQEFPEAQAHPELQRGGANPSNPYGTGDASQIFGQGLNEQRQGILDESNALSQEAQAENKALQEGIAKQQEQVKTFEQRNAELNQERQGFIQDIQNQHIDGNRYLNNMGGGQKVRTAIGLILGGMGGGLTHQANPALQFLQKQIENDIDAQKAELGKKQNLLGANIQQYRNIRDAMDMTRVMQSDIISNQLKAAAAQSKDPLVKARAMQAVGQLDQQASQTIMGITMRQMAFQGIQGATQGLSNPGVGPAQKILMLQKAGVMESGEAANAVKELKEAQGTVRARDNLLSAFDQIAKLNTVGNRTMSPLQSKSQIAALRDPLLASLSKDTAGRFTETDSKFIGSLFPSVTDSSETIARKRSALHKLVSEKMNFPALDQYQIPYDGGSRYTASGENKIKLGPPVQ